MNNEAIKFIERVAMHLNEVGELDGTFRQQREAILKTLESLYVKMQEHVKRQLPDKDVYPDEEPQSWLQGEYTEDDVTYDLPF